ncbi:MAG: TIM barrel protein [Opitutaceae bacterium]|nr:TIM barrel protein [Opitutaceae bacterium]
MDRRTFLSTAATLAAATAARTRAAVAPNLAWAGEVGLTTSSIFRQMTPGRADRHVGWLDLPKVMRDELGMRVLDFNSGSFASLEPGQLDKFRAALDAAGCVVSNVKVNTTVLGVKVQDLSIESPDRAVREAALTRYRDWITAAHHVGARWVRPFPADVRPDLPLLAEGLGRLADMADGRHMAVLLENAGWMAADADAIPRVVAAVGGRVGAQPDTGSWESPALREAGLRKAFPFAVSCDFKVGRLGPNGVHAAYDLKRCFDLGWQAGFRGPWVIEHAGENTRELFRELLWIRDQLKAWISAAGR